MGPTRRPGYGLACVITSFSEMVSGVVYVMVADTDVKHIHHASSCVDTWFCGGSGRALRLSMHTDHSVYHGTPGYLQFMYQARVLYQAKVPFRASCETRVVA